LSACAADPELVTRVEVLRPDYPPALFACAPEPPVPAAPVAERAALEYLARLRAAWLDCRWRLAEAGRLVAGEGTTQAR